MFDVCVGLGEVVVVTHDFPGVLWPSLPRRHRLTHTPKIFTFTGELRVCRILGPGRGGAGRGEAE